MRRRGATVSETLSKTVALRLADSTLGPSMMGMRDIARLIGVTYRTVQCWRESGELPPPDFALGRVIRWRPATIESFLKSRSAGGGGCA